MRMDFHVTQTPDGLLHVQNVLAGMEGQHHVHTSEGFYQWRRYSDKLIKEPDSECDCGLEAGQVRDHTGQVSTLQVR